MYGSLRSSKKDFETHPGEHIKGGILEVSLHAWAAARIFRIKLSLGVRNNEPISQSVLSGLLARAGTPHNIGVCVAFYET